MSLYLYRVESMVLANGRLVCFEPERSMAEAEAFAEAHFPDVEIVSLAVKASMGRAFSQMAGLNEFLDELADEPYFSTAEIAEAVGITAAAVRKRKLPGRRKRGGLGGGYEYPLSVLPEAWQRRLESRVGKSETGAKSETKSEIP